jgi:ATP-binding cassette subfamily G (WHITE) protein 2 (SNQ2)
MLTNEFRTLMSSCSNLIPRGPGYESVNVTNQVCTTIGAFPGQSLVNGERFVQLSFGYSFSNVWRVC